MNAKKMKLIEKAKAYWQTVLMGAAILANFGVGAWGKFFNDQRAQTGTIMAIGYLFTQVLGLSDWFHHSAVGGHYLRECKASYACGERYCSERNHSISRCDILFSGRVSRHRFFSTRCGLYRELGVKTRSRRNSQWSENSGAQGGIRQIPSFGNMMNATEK